MFAATATAFSNANKLRNFSGWYNCRVTWRLGDPSCVAEGRERVHGHIDDISMRVTFYLHLRYYTSMHGAIFIASSYLGVGQSRAGRIPHLFSRFVFCVLQINQTDVHAS